MKALSGKDHEILRNLAKKQVEMANSPIMRELRKDWKLHSAFSPSSRPMVKIETDTFADKLILPMMKCEGAEARKLEWELRLNMANYELFGDDTIVRDYMPVYCHRYFIPFNIEIKREFARMDNGELSIGHRFVTVIGDLEQDFPKLAKSRFGIDKEGTKREIDFKNEILGDILPARQAGFVLYCGPAEDIVHILKLEDMFTAMYDYPDLFHRMMNMLIDDYLLFFDMLEEKNELLPTADECHLPQGSYCFNDELPENTENLKTTDMWGYMDAEETTGISPEMFAEFFAPHYQRIIARYGLLSYGCCEAVNPIWNCFLSGLSKLRKVSVSAWADEEFIGERIKGRKIVYMRKPSANLLSIGNELDEKAVADDMNRTVKAAGGCHLEIIQRDVYQIHNKPEKVKRYVEIIRNCCEKHEN